MSDSITIERGRDGTIPIRCHVTNGRGGYVGARVSAAAVAGATSIAIERLGYNLTSGDMLQVKTTDGSDGMVVTLGADAAIGATTLTVTATPGPLKAGEQLEKLSNLMGYTIEMRIMSSAEDLVPIIPVANLPVTVPDQSTIANRGIFNVAVDSTDTTPITGGPFAGSAWRTDTGQHRKLWPAGDGVGQVNIADAGGVVT